MLSDNHCVPVQSGSMRQTTAGLEVTGRLNSGDSVRIDMYEREQYSG